MSSRRWIGRSASPTTPTASRYRKRRTARPPAAGDPDCAGCLDRYADRLARALAIVINLLDPDAIVLGGGLSQLDFLYAEVPRRWGRHILSDTIVTRLLPPRHGDSSGVRGAAW